MLQRGFQQMGRPSPAPSPPAETRAAAAEGRSTMPGIVQSSKLGQISISDFFAKLARFRLDRHRYLMIFASESSFCTFLSRSEGGNKIQLHVHCIFCSVGGRKNSFQARPSAIVAGATEVEAHAIRPLAHAPKRVERKRTSQRVEFDTRTIRGSAQRTIFTV